MSRNFIGREKGLEHSSKKDRHHMGWNGVVKGCIGLENSDKVCVCSESIRLGRQWLGLCPEKVVWGQNLRLQSSSFQTTEVFPFLPERWVFVF